MLLEQESTFDLTFIGAGLSCTFTFIHLIELLKKEPPQQCLRVCVVDKQDEFWTGIPYGQRSGSNSLIITSLKEFLPEQERILFKKWLIKNFDKISAEYKKTQGSLPAEWYQNNLATIETESWDKLYIPRHIFGIYLKEKISHLLNHAEKENILKCILLTGEVLDVQQAQNHFELSIKTADNSFAINSKKVVLSIGSPPKQNVGLSCSNSASYVCIEDMYEPALQKNMDSLVEFIHQSEGSKNILLLGSNASSLEMLYNFRNYNMSSYKLGKFYILSPSQSFPHLINDTGNYLPFEAVHMQTLITSNSVKASDILDAVINDVRKADKENIPIGDVYETISGFMGKLIDMLNHDEQLQFIFKYAVEIGKHQRRAGAEYLGSVDKLIAEKKIEFIKGKFVKQLTTDYNNFHFEYVDADDGKVRIFTEHVDIIINCVGSSDIKSSPSPLIQNLLKRKICIESGSKKGFPVNANFESVENFFVIGPLLSGTLNERLLIWHVESCPRIFFLSRQLASVLHVSFQNVDAPVTERCW